MTSIEEFKAYLRTEGKRSLQQIEANLKLLSFNKPELLDDIKFSVIRALNTLYFEMLDFLTWLEQENKVVKSRNVKVLIDDLKKDIDKVRDFQEYVSTLSSKDAIFKNPDLFADVQQNLIRRTQNLASEVLQYLEEMDVLEKELTDTAVILKSVDNYLLQTPQLIGKIKQKIYPLSVETFVAQKGVLASSFDALSSQVQEHYRRLRQLRRVSSLRKVLAELQLGQDKLDNLAKTVRKTDPNNWKQPSLAFEEFKKQLLEDLEMSLKAFAAAVNILQEVQKQLAA